MTIGERVVGRWVGSDYTVKQKEFHEKLGEEIKQLERVIYFI